MFDQIWYESLVKKIERADADEEIDDPKLLVQVELGLRLLEIMELTDEPADVVWPLLSAMPIPDTRLEMLDGQQRRALANARVLLRFGRFAWRDALLWYAKLPCHWRVYLIDETQPLQKPAQREPNGPAYVTNRLEVYDQRLFQRLTYKRQMLNLAGTGRVTFRTTRQRPRTVTAELDAEMVSAATRRSSPQLNGEERPRTPIVIEMAELRETAEELDQRTIARRLGAARWTWLLDNVIRLRRVEADGSLSEPNTAPLRIEDLLNLAGMVGSGKSTLMKLAAARGALSGQWRTTLVVGDTATAVNLADELNRLLVDGNTPIAVPLLGRTTRHYHLQRLYQSTTFRPDHWGLRWLDTRCALQGVVTPADLKAGPLQPGDEPCERLQAGSPDNPGSLLGCPFFAMCPSRQVYRDIPGAMIWITTPGAMATSRLPLAIDKRQMLLGEVVYHESDLVIFDEVDTIQQWFDNVYATDQWLLDGGQGMLDVLDIKTTEGLNHGYQISRQGQRWITAERSARQVAEHICSMLRDRMALKEWVGDRYFTAHRLFYDLARRLSNQSTNGQPAVNQAALGHFDRFRTDSMMHPSATNGSDALSQLHAIADQVLARSGSLVNRERVLSMCKAWLETHVSEMSAVLQRLETDKTAWLKKRRNGAQRRARGRPGIMPDDFELLAARLELAIAVAILEEMTQITFDGWLYAPLFIISQVADDYRLHRIPRDLAGVLPTSPTGSLFGFQYLEEAGPEADATEVERIPLRVRRFSTFQYRNVGRWYIQHFADLLDDLGYPGPQVLAMSGTSWLPDSATWHFPVTPKAILEPSEPSQRAIQASQFFFKPVRDGKGEPIFVSGSNNLSQQLALLARQIAGSPTPRYAFLTQELNELEALARTNPAEWQDRVRLLLFVNSYEQVTAVMQAILSQQPGWGDTTFGLIRSTETASSAAWQWTQFNGQTFIKNDIEQFGTTQGKILIAPLQAIGRGYNILNEQNVAAFGSVLFLTRPMPQPFDMQARAQWLNCHVLRRCETGNDDFWQNSPSYYLKAEALRDWAHDEWDGYDKAQRYQYLSPERKNDLAASLAGLIIQACGRLLRGGVPFRAFFADAAWAPYTARGTGPDTIETSLLLKMASLLDQYCQNPIGQALYAPLAAALGQMQGVYPQSAQSNHPLVQLQ